MNSPQWATFLPIKRGNEDEVSSALMNMKNFNESKISGILTYYREYEDQIQIGPDEYQDVKRVNEISLEVIDDYVIVFSGRKKARFVKNRINEIDEIEVQSQNIELDEFYEDIGKEGLLKPKNIHLANYSLNKYVNGNFKASVENKNVFEDLLEEDVKSITLRLNSFPNQPKIKFFREGQIRILGSSEENFEIIKKLTTHL